MRLAAAAATALCALPAATASAEELTVSMPSRVFLPGTTVAVVGDTVTWANSSNESHDVTAGGGAFSSGGVGPGSRFSLRADTAGTYAYVCAIHRTTMTGRLDVVPVALAGPPAPIAGGESALLTGRAPAGTAKVTLEEVGPGGAPRTSEELAADPQGRFATTVRPARTTAYRVVAPGGAASPVATVTVVDRVKVLVSARRGRRLVTLRVRTEPARPGDTVVLQLYSRERFAWRQVEHGTLDGRGRVELTLSADVRRLARVSLAREGVLVGRSAPLMTWRAGRVAPKGPRAPHGDGAHSGH